MNEILAVLRREAETGFPSFTGARLRATVPLTQVVINDLLRRIPGVPAGVVLGVQPGNRLVVRYGLVHASARLAPEARVGDGAPQVELDLASALMAWTLGKAVRIAGVRITGRRVTVDLGALDALAPFHDHWRHLARVRLQTTPGAVHVEVDVVVR